MKPFELREKGGSKDEFKDSHVLKLKLFIMSTLCQHPQCLTFGDKIVREFVPCGWNLGQEQRSMWSMVPIMNGRGSVAKNKEHLRLRRRNGLGLLTSFTNM